MSGSRIPSPARSEGIRSRPRRHRFRSFQSLPSPVCSKRPGKLSFNEQTEKQVSLPLSPIMSRRSVLSDNTDIETPGRESWWQRLEESSRDVLHVLKNNVPDQHENIDELMDVEILSQEKLNYTSDLPESSESESIKSIVLPQRKFFSRQETKAHKVFDRIIDNRENLTVRKSKINSDNTIYVGKKDFFNRAPIERNKAGFPTEFLSMLADKSLPNRTVDTSNRGQVRNLLGNRAGTKRKNIFSEFIVSESEEEIPDIQPNVFGFPRNVGQQRRRSSASQGARNTSMTSNETDLEFDDWNLLPSSTMVDNQFGNTQGSSSVKKVRLSNRNKSKVTNEHNTNTLNNSKQIIMLPECSINNKSKEKTIIEEINNISGNEEDKTLTKQIPQTEENTEHAPAELMLFAHDGDNDITLRYDNDDNCNVHENIVEEFNVTPMQLEKEQSITIKKSFNLVNISAQKLISPRLLNSSNSRSIIGINEINKTKEAITNNENKNHTINNSYKTNEQLSSDEMANKANHTTITASGKIVEGHQELYAPIDLHGEKVKDVSEKSNVVKLTTDGVEACDEIDNLEIQIENRNSSCSIEVIYSEREKNENEENSIVVDQEKERERDTVEENQEFEKENCATADDENRETDDENHESVKGNREKEDERRYANNEEIAMSSITENMETEDKANCEGGDKHNCENDNEKNREEGHSEFALTSMNSKIQVANKENCEEDDAENCEEYDAENCVEDDREKSDDDDIENFDEDDVENFDEDDEKNRQEEDEMQNETDAETDKKIEKSSSNENIQLEYEEEDEENQQDHNEDNESNVENEDTFEEDNDGNFEENCQEGDGNDDMEEDDLQNESNKEAVQQIEMSSTNENIQTEDEESCKEDDEESHRDDEEDNVEEDEMQNESNEKSNKLIDMSSMNENIQVDYEENCMEDDEENREEDEDGENYENTEEDEPDNEDNEHSNINENAKSKGSIFMANITHKSDHEASRVRQTTLEKYLEKVKKENLEKRRKTEKEMKRTLKAASKEPTSLFKVPARPKAPQLLHVTPGQRKSNVKKTLPFLDIGNLPPDVQKDLNYKPPRRYRPKNASWATNRLYKYLETKLKPEYDYNARVRAEKLVETIYDFTKEIRRQKVAPKNAVDALKHEMAQLCVVTTHFEFYNFFHDFIPREIRVKVVPDVVNKISLPKHGIYSNIIR